MAPCTGRPKALMTSSRCHSPHPYLVTGPGCMGCALGCIISLSCCLLMPTSHPCLRGPPRAEQRGFWFQETELRAITSGERWGPSEDGYMRGNAAGLPLSSLGTDRHS